MKKSNYVLPGIAIAASAAVFWWITRGTGPALPPPPGDPTDDPEVQATGWGVNDPCTNADLLAPAMALVHAEQWRAARSLPPIPFPGDQEGVAAAIAQENDRYFVDNFANCNRAPGSLLDSERVTSPEQLAADTAARIIAGEPVLDPLETFAIYAAGLGGLQ